MFVCRLFSPISRYYALRGGGITRERFLPPFFFPDAKFIFSFQLKKTRLPSRVTMASTPPLYTTPFLSTKEVVIIKAGRLVILFRSKRLL
jgi:hypothetical protein